MMTCTKCKEPIVHGKQKYHRTRKGPHHTECPSVFLVNEMAKKPAITVCHIADIGVIPAEEMRYPTVGDWYKGDDGRLLIRVSAMNDWRAEACVAVHELVEALICKGQGLTSEDIDRYDAEHEESGDEPDIPGSPYRRAHYVAYLVEMLLAKELGVDWTEYGKQLDHAYYKTYFAGRRLPPLADSLTGFAELLTPDKGEPKQHANRIQRPRKQKTVRKARNS